MKLIDYIKGTRRGREANRVERQAEVDPFLADAIDGYDAVYGNHTDKLKELDELIAKRAEKRNKGKVKIMPLTEAAPHMMPVGQEPPKLGAVSDRKAAKRKAIIMDDEPAAAASEPAKPEIEPEVKGKRAAKKVPLAPEEQVAARMAEMPAAVGYEFAAEESEAVMPAAPGKRRRSVRRVLSGITAAAAVLVMGGAAWYFFTQRMPVEEVQVATDFSKPYAAPDTYDPTVVLPFEVFEEELIAYASTVDLQQVQQQAAIAQATVQQQQQRVQQTEAQSERRADVRRVEPIAMESEAAFADNASSRQKEEIAEDARVIANADIPAMDILALASTPAATRSVSPQAKAKAEAETTAMSDMAVILQPDDANAPDQPVGSTSAAASAVAGRVSNSAFNSYFLANSKLRAAGGTKGEVVVEFRVNSRGVPTSIKVISSPSAEAGREVVNLLGSGPKWTPTDGNRIRTTVSY